MKLASRKQPISILGTITPDMHPDANRCKPSGEQPANAHANSPVYRQIKRNELLRLLCKRGGRTKTPMTQIPPKAGSTTTIAFRVSPSIDEQIQEIAKTLGQSKSNWVRDQVMQSFHSSDSSNTPPVHSEIPTEEVPPIVLAMIEARFEACEKLLRSEIDGLTATIVQAAESLHRDLCTLGILVLDAQESIEQRTDDSCDQLLDAIERLKQSQRSHKESLQRAITRPEDTTR